LEQWLEAEQWLARADEDLRVAELIIRHDSETIRSAAFHCQQVAEKIAKAALVALSIAPPRIHDLVELAAILRSKQPELAHALAELGVLTTWYMSARYPDFGFEFTPSLAELHSIIVQLHELRKRVDRLAPRPL
jgi:HEPN domain-containing protein